jgi:hypothetical protein
MKNWPMVGILLMVVFLGCTSNRINVAPAALAIAPISPPAKLFAGGVILSPEAVEDSQLRRQGNAPFWKPSTHEVEQAISRITAYLASDSARDGHGRPSSQFLLPLIEANLPQTLCQAVGVTRRGQRAILLNCIPAGTHFTSSSEWQYRYIRWYDAGPRWWSVVYFPTTGNFSELRIDRGF